MNPHFFFPFLSWFSTKTNKFPLYVNKYWTKSITTLTSQQIRIQMKIKKCVIKTKALYMLNKSTNYLIFSKKWREMWREYLRQIGIRPFWIKLLNSISKWGWIQLLTTSRNYKDLSKNSIKSILSFSICFITNSHLLILIKINIISRNWHQSSIGDNIYRSLMLNSLWCAKINIKSGKYQHKNWSKLDPNFTGKIKFVSTSSQAKVSRLFSIIFIHKIVNKTQ